MPWLPGSDLSDASGVGLLDAVAALLGEAGLDFSAIVSAVNSIKAMLEGVFTGSNLQLLYDLLALVPGVGQGFQVMTLSNALTTLDTLNSRTVNIYADTHDTIIPQLGYNVHPAHTVYEDIAAVGAFDDTEILNAIAAVRGSGIPDLAAVLTAIGAIPAPPSGADVATDVWDYQFSHMSNWAARYILGWAGAFANSRSKGEAYPYFSSPWMQIRGVDYLWDHGYFYPGTPTGDWSDVQAADTRLTWLTRTEPTWTWIEDYTTGRVYAIKTDDNEPKRHFVFALTEQEFQNEKGTAPANIAGAPIWPGLANVDLGTPVPISGDTEVAGPMDGVLVALTTVPPGKGFWSAGSRHAYKYAGYVAFTTDNGDAEEQQYLGFDSAVYCPRRSVQAASCLIHCAEGIDGTATPWTKVA